MKYFGVRTSEVVVRPFLVCIHDATPAHDLETRVMIRDLAPLIGRSLSVGVVPDWHGQWPLAAHPDYCRLVQESADDLLLHGYFHRRQHGWGPATLLTDGSDEMNGLDRDETHHILERAQRDFTDAFGRPARGFLAPAWQSGHVRLDTANPFGLDHVLGFFSVTSESRRIPLATWTWDSSRWSWTGHVGHGIGRLLHSLGRGVPTLAIHPRDIERGFWPAILRLTEQLLESGCEPSTVSGLLRAGEC